tara:strand:+ start:816 stop:1367 length:552 start_codon:yes stop_codon:yes gene_type:complete
MPNWCENNITISHKDKKKITEIAEVCMRDNPRLFNFIKPEPDWAKTPNDKGELPKSKDVKNEKGEIIFLRKEFPDGTPDERWYDWNCDNWGTKWDIYEFHQETFPIDNHGGEYHLEMGFDTAWSPPIGIYETLKEKGFYVYADYIEGGVGYCGTWVDGVDNEYKLDEENIPEQFQDMRDHWAG